MEISQASLAWLYFCAFLLGAVLAIVYDLLRITRIFFGVRYSRRAFKGLQTVRLPFLKPYQKRAESRLLGVIIFFEDFFFCIFAAASMIILFYQLNNGNFRFPAAIAAGAGFLLYRGTLGRFVMLVSEFIAFFIEVTVRYILFFTTLPFRYFAALLIKLTKRFARKVDRVHQRSDRKHYTSGQLARLKKDACGMIPNEKRKMKSAKRGKYIAKGKKTIQLDASDADPLGVAGYRIDRSVRQ